MISHQGRWTERLVAGCQIVVRLLLWLDVVALSVFCLEFILRFLEHFREYLLRTIFGHSW